MKQHLADMLDRPAFALLGTAASSVATMIADASQAASSVTAWCGAGTATLIFFWWVRKFVIQALHDLKAFKSGRLPKVETSEPK